VVDGSSPGELIKQLEIKVDRMGSNDWDYRRDPVYHTLTYIKGKTTMKVRRDGVRMTTQERVEHGVDEAGFVVERVEQRVKERAFVIE
jgi:hypothetical protein